MHRRSLHHYLFCTGVTVIEQAVKMSSATKTTVGVCAIRFSQPLVASATNARQATGTSPSARGASATGTRSRVILRPVSAWTAGMQPQATSVTDASSATMEDHRWDHIMFRAGSAIVPKQRSTGTTPPGLEPVILIQ